MLSFVIMCWIVLVVLYYKDNFSNEVKMYVFLDDVSDMIFIMNKLKNEIGIEGVSISFNLCIMYGCEVVLVFWVDGLVVECFDRCVKVDLLKVYVRDLILLRKD